MKENTKKKGDVDKLRVSKEENHLLWCVFWSSLAKEAFLRFGYTKQSGIDNKNLVFFPINVCFGSLSWGVSFVPLALNYLLRLSFFPLFLPLLFFFLSCS